MTDRIASDRPFLPRRTELLWRELVGDQLREIRQSRGETLRDVAKSARVSPQYLSEIERGLKEPSSEILAAVVESLETTLLDLTVGVAERLLESRSASKGAFTLAA